MRRRAAAVLTAVFLLASAILLIPAEDIASAATQPPAHTPVAPEKGKEEDTEKIVKMYYGLSGRNVPGSIRAEDGRFFVLEDVIYKADEITAVKRYVDYDGEEEIPQNIKISINGGTVEGILINTEQEISETYCMPFTVKGKFYGDNDSMYYQFEKNFIPAETAPQFDGYSEELSAYLDLDPAVYRIDGGKWTSGYFKEGKDTVRMAEYDGMRKIKAYKASYEGRMYSARAVYVEAENGNYALDECSDAGITEAAKEKEKDKNDFKQSVGTPAEPNVSQQGVSHKTEAVLAAVFILISLALLMLCMYKKHFRK